MSRCLALALLFLAAAARAQPDAVVLVARPQLADPNFRESVVLVTHTPSGDTVGVVLNRPAGRPLAEIAPEFPGAANFSGPVYEGGPVLKRVIVALFHAASPPAAAAFRVLPDTYLSMHPDNIVALLRQPPRRLRFFAGFAGWAPGQLEAEIVRESWYVLPVTEDLLFRNDTSGMWQELIARARSHRAARARSHRAIYSPE